MSKEKIIEYIKENYGRIMLMVLIVLGGYKIADNNYALGYFDACTQINGVVLNNFTCVTNETFNELLITSGTIQYYQMVNDQVNIQTGNINIEQYSDKQENRLNNFKNGGSEK